MLISGPITISPRVSADQYDDQINAIQQEIDAYQDQARKLKDQADSLQVQLTFLNNEKAQIQGQIDLSQAKFDKLQQQIKDTEKTIVDNKVAMGDTLANLYIDNKITPLEMLASSKNIGDYVDKHEYRTSVQEQLTKTINKIKTLKKSLEKQKVDVKRVLADQTNAKSALSAKVADQERLFAATRGEESAYQQLSAQSNAQKLLVQQKQQDAMQKVMTSNGPIKILPGDPNKGGYPWEAGCYVDSDAISHDGPNGKGGDPLGYGCRQCVSYAAWKMLDKTGYEARYWGNANMWPQSARRAGFSTGNTPRPGSLGVISEGDYGHIVYIEGVNNDGTVDISQYNFKNAGGSGWGNYSKMRVSSATYDTYIYI